MSSRDDTFFIYPKDKLGNKTGHCIAVILRDGLMFEGTALCSRHDQFCRKTGRLLAFERAQQAYQRWLIRSSRGTP